MYKKNEMKLIKNIINIKNENEEKTLLRKAKSVILL